MLELERHFSLWMSIPLTGAFIALSVEVGFRIGRWVGRRPSYDHDRAASDLATPTVGLLGLMLAFTFAWSASRFDARRQARFEEVKTLASMFHYADFLPAGDRARVRGLLRTYIDVSLTAQGTAGFERAFEAREKMHHELWAIAVAAGHADPHSEITALQVETMNDILNAHLGRSVAAVSSRIPLGIFAGLITILAVTMGMLGYQVGLTSASRSPALLPLLVAVTVVMFLIIDLDRPLEGLVRLGDRGLLELQRELETWP